MPPGKTTPGTGPPKPNSPTQTTAPNTRKTTRSQTTVEEIMATSSSVMDTESAEAYLASKLLCQVGQPFTLTHLSTILFHITQMSTVTPVPVNAAIRAVAFLLKKQVVCEIAEAAAKELALTLSGTLTESLSARLVDHTIAALAPQIAGVHAASETLAKTAKKTEDTLTITLDKAERLHRLARDERTEQEGGVSVASERLEETADALYATVTDCQNTIKLLAPSLDATQDRINHLSLQLTSTPSPSPPTTQPTYSSVAAAHLPPKVDQAVGRAAVRAREILLDPNPGSSLFPPGTANREIASHLKEAINNIRDDSTPPGSVRAITTLRNGGIVVELESEELASWLRSPTGRTSLESQFESTVSFRSRTFALVLEYLPIHLQIENDDFLHRVEEENQLPADTLTSIRWIKPLNRRSNQQRKAFALLQVSDAPTANNILRDGLCIDNERISIWKNKKEPIRCAKCQRYGHIARSCTDEHDTCGTCGEHHRSTQCNAYRTTRCVNCRSNNHTSWSRKCPEFLRRCDLLDEKFPENKMPYFPTEVAWTHAIIPPRPPRLPSHFLSPLIPQDLLPQTNDTLRQTTLALQRLPILPSPSPQPNSPSQPFTAAEILKDIYPPLDPDPELTSPPNTPRSSQSSQPSDSSPSSPPTHV